MYVNLRYLKISEKKLINITGVENSKDFWVEENNYEITGDTVNGKGGTSKARLCNGPSLFNNLNFHFYGKIKSPPSKELKTLAKLGGANIISNLQTTSSTKIIVLVDVNEDNDLDDLLEHPSINVVVSYKWLLDSAGQYERKSFDTYCN